MSKNWSEREVIKLINKNVEEQYANVIKGVGDDCAVFETDPEQQLLVTTDMLVEDIHFSLAWHPPFELGRKSIAVNVSDIAAMGGNPQYLFISLCLPDHIEMEWITQWFSGVDSILKEFGCFLAGGDTVRGRNLTINVTVIGSANRGRAVLRQTANSDQSIFVSGQLGSAAAGLKMYQHTRHSELRAMPVSTPFKKQHLNPLPDVACGLLLSENGLATAMQDISDGIATDLSHICTASNIGAVIEERLLPFHPDLPAFAEQMGCNLRELVISGGEDYHLVFTVKKSNERILEDVMGRNGISVYRIGKTISESGLFLDVSGQLEEITYGGFEH